MRNRIVISAISLLASLLALGASATPSSAAEANRCMSGSEATAEALTASAEAGGYCQGWVRCTYNCDFFPEGTPCNAGGCPGEIFCGSWGGYCGESCVATACIADEM